MEYSAGDFSLAEYFFFMRVFLSAGEPSGDHHAALLVRALRARRADIECVGLGGPCMAAEGCRLLADLTRLAVMWLLRVIPNLHHFLELVRRAERSFLDNKPDVCVLIDFPGFHWWLAWRAKRHGIPVVFYCPPQIWAWASWRVGKMRRLIDHVLSALPFEHDWFVSHGISSKLVGHPFFDELLPQSSQPSDLSQPPLVLLLPGSRHQEIEANLPSILRSVRLIHAEVPQVRFIIAAQHKRHALAIHEKLDAAAGVLAGVNLSVEVGQTRRLIAATRCAIAVSGSVSLELLAARVPAVIVYRIGAAAFVVQSWLRHARFITLVNLLAVGDPIGPVRGVWRPSATVAPADPEAVYPEYLAVRDPADLVAGHLIGWLKQPESQQSTVQRLHEVAALVEQGGSAGRAAETVLSIGDGRQPQGTGTMWQKKARCVTVENAA